MNCDLKLLKGFQAHEDILDDIKKLSKLGRLLLEKDPNYQNDVYGVYLYLGTGGLVHSEVTYSIVLTTAQIKLYSYNFKFYDVKKQKIRDCAIYSRFHHFSEGGISFELNGNVYNVGLSPTGDKFCQRSDYKRYLFKYDPYYQCQNQIFIFDTANDTFITNDGDYHQVISGRYQRCGRGGPDPN